MQRIISHFYQNFENTPRRITPYRWLVIAVCLVITLVMAEGMHRNFAYETSNESWLEDDAPELHLRDQFRSLFGSEDGVFIVYKPSSGDVFSESALRTLIELHNELAMVVPRNDAVGEQLARIVKIDSLYNARYQVADGDTLISRKLIGSDFPESDDEREARRTIAMAQDNFSRLFYSEDFRYGGLQLKTDFGVVPIVSDQSNQMATGDDLLASDEELLGSGGFDRASNFVLDVDADSAEPVVKYKQMIGTDYAVFMDAVRAITSQPKYADFEFYYAGNAIANDFMTKASNNFSIIWFSMLAVMGGFLWWLFRSMSAVVWPLLIVVLSAIWSIGLSCWLGFTFTGMLSVSVMLILAVVIASCVHVFSAHATYSQQGCSYEQSIANSYRKTGAPILLTSFTTSIGMLSLALTDFPNIQVFGYTSAFGVAFSFLLILALLPCLLSFWHPGAGELTRSNAAKQQREIKVQALISRVGKISEKHPKKIVVFYFALFIVMLAGCLQTVVDTSMARLGREGTPVQQAFKIIDENMMGGNTMEVLLRSEAVDFMKDPRVLSRIENIQDRISSEFPEKIVKTFSLADIVKQSNRIMHEDRPEYDAIPEDPRLTAQLLYLFNNSNSEDRRSLVTDDYRASHISILMRTGTVLEYLPIFDYLLSAIDEEFEPLRAYYPDLQVELTGSFPLFIKVVDGLLWNQLKSFGAALGIICLVMMLALGSVQAGLVAMVPNLLPAVFTFGLMGWTGMRLDIDILLIAPVIIGIAVDDTIHFLSHYKYVWLESGNADKAVDKTLKDVGQAVLFTSLILSLGFAVISLSDYVGMVKPGLLGALAIIVALLSDLFFLPAMMRWFKPSMGRASTLRI